VGTWGSQSEAATFYRTAPRQRDYRCHRRYLQQAAPLPSRWRQSASPGHTQV